jgi:hypothetical protein
MIEELIASTYGPRGDVRRRHLFGHALRALVRMAKAEQMQEVRRDVERAAGRLGASEAREEAEQVLRKIGMNLRPGRGVEDGRPLA